MTTIQLIFFTVCPLFPVFANEALLGLSIVVSLLLDSHIALSEIRDHAVVVDNVGFVALFSHYHNFAH
jgi:hypothetical protein